MKIEKTANRRARWQGPNHMVAKCNDLSESTDGICKGFDEVNVVLVPFTGSAESRACGSTILMEYINTIDSFRMCPDFVGSHVASDRGKLV
jgi:hypothetical protein